MEKKEKVLLNPFVVNGRFSVRCYRAGSQAYMVDKEEIKKGGIVDSPVTTIDRFKYFDGAVCTKVFHGQHEDTIIGLKNNAKNLFLWIVMNLESKQEYIKLDATKVCNELSAMVGKYGKTSYFSAITELKGAAIIAHREKGTYWINPSILFNGNRLNFYQHYVDGKNYTNALTVREIKEKQKDNESK